MVTEVRQFDQVEDKNVYNNNMMSIFLAGGISNSKKNWQSNVINNLTYLDIEYEKEFGKNKFDILIYNPREISSNKESKPTMDEIIAWDMDKLTDADIASFYFSDESTQASTMFELGYMLGNRHIDDITQRVIVSINVNYNHRWKLISYLKNILRDNYDEIVFDDCISEDFHAINIYRKYQAYSKDLIKRRLI